MKNILIVTSGLYIGGAERVIANLVKHIDLDRFNVVVCHLKGRGEIGDELLREGYRVVGVQQSHSIFTRYFSFLKLRRIVDEYQIDLMHSHTTLSLVDCALMRIFFSPIKLVHTFHYGNYPHYVKRYMYLERVFSRVTNRLVAVGAEQCKTLLHTYGIAPAQFVTIRNGVEWSGSSPDREWQERLARAGRPVIGTICTFIEQKGLTYLLDTALRMTQQGIDAVFVIVGDGPLRGEIEARCRVMGLAERVYFTGWKQNAAISMLPLFDVFFQPSLWEAMSMVVLEAMAAGRPVVVTDVGDNRHVVAHGETGMVVPTKDVDAMARSLSTLVNSRELCEQYGEAGQQRFKKNYTARTMAQRYEELYSDVLSE